MIFDQVEKKLVTNKVKFEIEVGPFKKRLSCISSRIHNWKTNLCFNGLEPDQLNILYDSSPKDPT